MLVKIECAPLNPTDLFTVNGMWEKAGVEYEYPFVAGSEGAGTVVAYGGGLMGWRLMGKRVSCFSNVKASKTHPKSIVGGTYQ